MATRAGESPPPREIEHTADLGFEVEGPTLGAVFERAGLAMLAYVADLDSVRAEDAHVFEVATEGDLVDLLHDFLTALLVEAQTRRFVACALHVVPLDGRRLRVAAWGERVDAAGPRLHGELKGVTYHQLAVEETAAGWRARVILDV